MLTKVITNEDFKGNKMFKIYEVDENGNKIFEFDRKTGEKKEKKPLVNIGMKKAMLINKYEDELKVFVEGN